MYFSTVELFLSETFNLGHLFKIPYDTLIDIIYAFNKDLHISFENFQKMYWFEILMLIDKHNEFIENQNSESDSQNDIIAQQQANMESMYRKQQQSIPKMETPKFDMPNIGNFKI